MHVCLPKCRLHVHYRIGSLTYTYVTGQEGLRVLRVADYQIVASIHCLPILAWGIAGIACGGLPNSFEGLKKMLVIIVFPS